MARKTMKMEEKALMKPSSQLPSSSSSSFYINDDQIKQPSCSQTTYECGVNGCLLCVSCPLSVAWCFVVFPFKLGKAAVKNVWRNHKRCFCCGGSTHGRVLPDYSTSSDLDPSTRQLTQNPNPNPNPIVKSQASTALLKR